MADKTDAETMQCATVSMMGKRCAYVSGHSGDHLYQTGNEDLSDEIRLKLLRDRRDKDAETIAALRAEVERLTTRQQELLVTIRNLSSSVPYPEEAGSTAVLIAKVGTLRADLARVTAERDEARKAQTATPAPTFNHTRADGPFDPCPSCLVMMDGASLIALVKDLRECGPRARIEAETAGRIAAWLDKLDRAAWNRGEQAVGDLDIIAKDIRAGAWKETP